MITIGQLARYVGVSTKTIRVYHDKGLLAEPARDASGYRRYSAQDAADLIKIRTLAVAGVPLSRIRTLMTAPPEALHEAFTQIDHELTKRIQQLHATQRRLRDLAAGHSRPLPDEVHEYLIQLGDLGFSQRWIALQADLWLLVFATHPEAAPDLLRDQASAVGDLELRRIFLTYDQACDLEPDDPQLGRLAHRIVRATTTRYGRDTDLPGQATNSAVPQLIQDSINAMSPAWKRVDFLVRRELGQRMRR